MGHSLLGGECNSCWRYCRAEVAVGVSQLFGWKDSLSGLHSWRSPDWPLELGIVVEDLALCCSSSCPEGKLLAPILQLHQHKEPVDLCSAHSPRSSCRIEVIASCVQSSATVPAHICVALYATLKDRSHTHTHIYIQICTHLIQLILPRKVACITCECKETLL